LIDEKDPMEDQRLDKWLWCARLFKTRGHATEAIKAGRVNVNGVRAKPARAIRTGDALNIRRPPYEFHLTVTGLVRQRVAAGRVGELYLESEQSISRREELSRSIEGSAVIADRRRGKLTKRERRARERLKWSP
jgi:ribosome-associated heat shock protein Hsp15